MKNYFKNAARIVFSKITLLTVVIHWIFVSLAIYERDGLYHLFHFTYEPLLFQVIIMLNFPTGIVADLFLPGNPFINNDHPRLSILMLITSVTFQWTVIGSFIKYLLFSDKKHK